MNRDTSQLIRGLTLSGTTALVIGTVIGSGVFLKAAPMAQALGSSKWVLIAWVAAGMLSMAGALVYAELGAMIPEAGGEYAFLRRSYGTWASYLYGWQRFVVAGSASIASLAVGFSIFLSSLIPLQGVWFETDFVIMGTSLHWQLGAKQVVAVGAIMVLTAMNCLTVAFGGKVQSLLTALKMVGIALVCCGIFFFSKEAKWDHVTQVGSATFGISAFGTAMLAALWGYDGWNNMPMVAGEVRDPARNIPRALILGLCAVMAIYCTLNFAYFYALPIDAIATCNSTKFPDAPSVAVRASETFLGTSGGKLVSLVGMLSIFGALNGSVLSNARVPYAMARDGLFFPAFGKLHAQTRVPVVCLLVQGMWASMLALSGTFDQLTDYLLFASWIFYALTASSVFVLRVKEPATNRPFKTLGYPIVPLAFILVAIWLIGNTIWTRPIESLLGTLLILAGLPVYLIFAKRWQNSRSPQAE